MATFFLPHHRRFFYHRTTIPKALRHFFGSRLEYWRCLHTSDKDEARLKSAMWESRVRRVFVTLKLRGKTMTVDQIEELITRWIDTTLEEAEDFRATSGPVSDNYRESQLNFLTGYRNAVVRSGFSAVKSNHVRGDKDDQQILPWCPDSGCAWRVRECAHGERPPVPLG